MKRLLQVLILLITLAVIASAQSNPPITVTDGTHTKSQPSKLIFPSITVVGGEVTLGGGTGTVTAVSGVNANGFTFSIANPTTTPAITLSCATCVTTAGLTAGTLPVPLTSTTLGDSSITIIGAITTVGSAPVTALQVDTDNHKVFGYSDSLATDGPVFLATNELKSEAQLSAARGGFGANVAAQNGIAFDTNGVFTFLSSAGTGNVARAAGAALTGLTGLGIRSTGTAFDLTLASSEVLTAGRTLSFNVGDAARTLTLTGSPTIAGVTISGNVPAPSTSGNVMTSNGSAWISTAPPAGGGITIGTTTITGGTATRLLYETSGNVAGEISGLTSNGSTTLVQTSNSAAAFESGPNGSTNPVFRLVNNVASAATGLEVKGNASGSGVTLTALGGTNESIYLTPKGSGTVSVPIGNSNAIAPALAFGTSLLNGFSDANGQIHISYGTTDIVGFGGSDTIRINAAAPLGWSSSTPVSASSDVAIARVAAKVLKLTTGQTTLGGWLQWAGQARMTADATNATATFSNLTDLTISNLQAGRKYTGRMTIKCINSTATEGIQFDFNGGSATMTNFFAAAGILSSGGTDVIGTNISTSLAGVINFTTFTGESVVVFDISFVVNGAGTLIPRFAENSSTVGTATVRLGSFVILNDSPN